MIFVIIVIIIMIMILCQKQEHYNPFDVKDNTEIRAFGNIRPKFEKNWCKTYVPKYYLPYRQRNYYFWGDRNKISYS